MLLQFRFQNFKSFRDDTILDLTATKITEHQDHVTEIGGEKVLPAAAIFGANASGKSNVIQAFNFMQYYVQQSFAFGGGEPKERQPDVLRPQGKPFAFDKKSISGEALFEVFFTDEEKGRVKFYDYGFTLNQEGVAEEWLNAKNKSSSTFKPVFYRGAEELDLSGIGEKRQENISVSLERKTLIVSLGAKLKVKECKNVFDWFYSQIIADLGDPDIYARISKMILRDFVLDEAVRQSVVKYVAAFDPSIIGFHVEKSPVGEDIFEIWSIHRTVGTEETALIPLSEESSGTQKMFFIYPILQSALKWGATLYVDELNARLHPLLMRSVLISFLDPEVNKNHAQIVFTTHNTLQLSDHLLRRDEIWFTEKNSDGVSSLYSLADFVDEGGTKVRKDESYEKNYLLGKYGAIPNLKHLFGED